MDVLDGASPWRVEVLKLDNENYLHLEAEVFSIVSVIIPIHTRQISCERQAQCFPLSPRLWRARKPASSLPPLSVVHCTATADSEPISHSDPSNKIET